MHPSGSARRGRGPVVAPIYQSANFTVANLDEQEAVRHSDAFYTRYGNPTHSEAEAAVAALEGAQAALVFSAGMAAISSSILNVVKGGDHVVAQREVYGSAYDFLKNWLPRYGVETTFAGAADTAGLEAAIRPNTRLLYIESPTNPTLRLTDIGAIVALARRRGIVTLIDSTFASPVNQRPLALGVDAVIHSATKYLAGHSDLVCGVVAGSREFIGSLRKLRIMLGGVMDPHAAWLLCRGIKTLAVRVERQNANALSLARFLEQHPAVASVHYPFLESHPQYELARRQMRGGGGVLSFEVKGGAAEARRCAENLDLFALAGSLGSVESLVTLPAMTSHAMLSPEDRAAAGVTDTLVRLAVGIEHAADLEADLSQALAASWPVGAV